MKNDKEIEVYKVQIKFDQAIREIGKDQYGISIPKLFIDNGMLVNGKKYRWYPVIIDENEDL